MQYGQSIDDGGSTQGLIPRLLGLYIFLFAIFFFKDLFPIFILIFSNTQIFSRKSYHFRHLCARRIIQNLS